MLASRLQKEIIASSQINCDRYSLTNDENNSNIWNGFIKTEIGSYFGGSTVNLKMDVPKNFPFTGPKVQIDSRFNNACFMNGVLRLTVMRDWSPVFTLSKFFLMIVGILNMPNEDFERQQERFAIIKEELYIKVYGQLKEGDLIENQTGSF